MCTSPSPHPGKASKEQWHPPVRMEPVAPVPWHLVPRTGCHYTEFFKSAPNDSGIEPGMLYGRFGAYWCAPRRRRISARPPNRSGTQWNQWHPVPFFNFGTFTTYFPSSSIDIYCFYCHQVRLHGERALFSKKIKKCLRSGSSSPISFPQASNTPPRGVGPIPPLPADLFRLRVLKSKKF